jgi:hypothetical protein
MGTHKNAHAIGESKCAPIEKVCNYETKRHDVEEIHRNKFRFFHSIPVPI